MLILISPAKTLDFETPAPTADFSQTDFLKQSKLLIRELRGLSPQKISTLMHISDKLGVLNAERFARWKTPFSLANAKQALFAFQGDVYTGMQAEKFSVDEFIDRLIFMEKVELGVTESKAGISVSTVVAKKRLKRWLK